MSAANGTQRDIGLDLTRILAFLAVPSVHFFLNSTYYDTAIVGPRMALMTVMRTAFMVCVPLYMLLSGYLSAEKHIPLTRPGLLGYYKKLLPIFLTYALSTGVILLYRVLWLGEEQTIRSAVKNLLSFQQYSWYMNMYFGLLLLTPFLNALWQSLATPAARRALLAVLLVLTVLPGMVNIYHLHSAETLLHPWLSTSYDQLVPDWWQRLYPITYYFLGGYLRAHVDIKRLRTGRLAALLLLAVLCTVFSRVDAKGAPRPLMQSDDALERWSALWQLGRLGEPAKRGGHGAGISSAELHPIFHPPLLPLHVLPAISPS